MEAVAFIIHSRGRKNYKEYKIGTVGQKKTVLMDRFVL